MSKQDIEYLYGLQRFGVKLGLETMKEIMDLLGHPERQFASVHITGTNGKGSTASMIASVMEQAGYTVGLYTSPHIYSFHERIRINGAPIDEAALEKLIRYIRTTAEAAGIEQTFFEYTTALAFLYFAQQKVDIAIVEVGFGGGLDATNVIKPEVAAITNIGLDHMEVLGDTKEKIARDKAGIIKPGSVLVTGEQEDHLLEMFAEACRVQGASFVKTKERITGTTIFRSLSGQRVRVSGAWEGEVELPLLGDHQVENMETALAVLSELGLRGYPVSFPDVRRGLARTKWEGRLDVVSQEPLIVVDGAHNEDGIEALRRFVQDLPRKDVLVFGVKAGKDVAGMAAGIVPLFDHVIVTKGSYQPVDPAIVARELAGLHDDVRQADSVAEALRLGKEILGEDPKAAMVVAGSLYVIADALAVLRNKKILQASGG